MNEYVLQCKLVSGQGLLKCRSAPFAMCGLFGSRRIFSF